MSRILKTAVSGVVAVAMLTIGSTVAVPTAQSQPMGYSGGRVILVKNHWHGKHGHPYHGAHHHYYYEHDNSWAGPVFGFAAGALLGSLLASPYAYHPYPYHPRYMSRDAYCHAKYRSYNSWTRTYTGYDGRQHPCI